MKRTMMVLAVFLTTGPQALAARIPDLTRYLRDEIATLDAAVEDADRESDGSPRAETANEEAWYFRNFWIRLRTPVAFEIPGIAKVQVIPETELLWERPNPSGWSSYKP